MSKESSQNTDYIKIQDFKAKLRKDLSENRYAHTLRTVSKAIELCVGTNADKEVVFWAALLHDCAKYAKPTEEQKRTLADFDGFDKVIHAPLGAIIAKEKYGIEDERILNAICYHTTGRANMSIEEMVVYLADAIEDGRDYPNLERIRKAAEISIQYGVLTSLKGILGFDSEKNKIHHLTSEAIKFLEENNGQG